MRDDGAERRLEGTATPTDATSGKLKVRVFVSKRIELIFNTTYRFLKSRRSPTGGGIPKEIRSANRRSATGATLPPLTRNAGYDHANTVHVASVWRTKPER